MRPDSPELGDVIVAALHLVGFTEKRVSAWLGRPCQCMKRAVKLNRLSRWAYRVLQGREREPETALDRMAVDNKESG